MGLILTDFFEPRSYDVEDTEVIVCDGCLAHLCLSSLVLSDQFWGLSGDAFLVDRLINILCEKQDLETSMRTGVYIINKIRCLQCSTKLGWHYKKSFKYSEYYKEGKYVIEKKYIRQIPNHSSTARLTEQAKLLKRRRSSASTTSSLADDDSCIHAFRSRLGADGYGHVGAGARPCDEPGAPLGGFRDGISQLLTRHRSLAPEKTDPDGGRDEPANVRVNP